MLFLFYNCKWLLLCLRCLLLAVLCLLSSFSVLKFYTELILNLNSSRELILQGHIEEKGTCSRKEKNDLYSHYTIYLQLCYSVYDKDS